MDGIKVDFLRKNGKIKAMNAVNNGPAGASVRGDNPFFKNYKNARIPFARLHDSSFYAGYGGEWAVDVHRIFRDFNADESNPASYIFEPTDKYLANIVKAGTKIFYRLGASIEHDYKFGTIPPKDTKKWARICEHIIRHYTEGWANGFFYDIEYWEIWNEPDCKNADGSNPCWQGTMQEFFDFYVDVSKYLKEKFPNLKIGGPAVCTIWQPEFTELFLSNVREKKGVLDFFSYHCYCSTVEDMKASIQQANSLLEKYGFGDVETSLNEWNYIKGWFDEIYKESMRTIKGLKGSSFMLGCMCVGQASKVDIMMYYDARPTTGFNGFNMETEKPLKSYYGLKAFADVRDLENAIDTVTQGDFVYTVASANEKEGALLITYFNDDKTATAKEIKVEFANVNFGQKVKVEYYLLDETHDCELVREEIFTANEFASYFKMDLYSTCLIKILAI